MPTNLIRIPSDELQNRGFLFKAGDQRLKIGIRPEHIVEENIPVKKLLPDERKTTGHLQMIPPALKDLNHSTRRDDEFELGVETVEGIVSNFREELLERSSETSNNLIKNFPQVPRTSRKNPKFLGTYQNYSEVPTTYWKFPEFLGSFQNFPKVARIFRKFPELSKKSINFL